MHADCGVERRIAIGQADAGFEIGRPVAGADRDHVFHAGGERALDHGVAVRVELLVVQMAVGVDQHLLQARSDGNIFEETASTGMPSSSDAATIMPCDSRPRSFARRQVRHDHHFASHQSLRFVGHGDAGHDAARLRLADIDVQMQEFVGAFHGSGGLHQPHAQVHFSEIVDGDLGAITRLGRRFGWRGLAEHSPAGARTPALPVPSFFRSTAFGVGPRKDAADRAQLLPGWQVSPVQIRRANLIDDGLLEAELRPDFRGRFRNHGIRAAR